MVWAQETAQSNAVNKETLKEEEMAIYGDGHEEVWQECFLTKINPLIKSWVAPAKEEFIP